MWWAAWNVVYNGLSPRVRGKRGYGRIGRGRRGSIPACAGEALPQRRKGRQSWVYPRVCGGSRSEYVAWQRKCGLSPRVRGKLVQFVKGDGGVGSIPACAGEAGSGGSGSSRPAVYPRVCGGSGRWTGWQSEKHGLSPRVRGKRIRRRQQRHVPGSIPACAGEASVRRTAIRTSAVYPRVCGGSFRPAHGDTDISGLSPRVRGKPFLGDSC